MTTPIALISGSGVAGPTLAYWLARAGFSVTIVESASTLRSSGSPVDVRGPAVSVAEQMGVMGRIRDVAMAVERLVFVDGTGRQVGRVNMKALQTAAGSLEAEVARGDLAAILYDASKDDVDYRFGTSIAALEADDDGVDVRFDDGKEGRFDLVVGADGLHSAVRRLAFGPEAQFVHPTGMFVATTVLEGPVEHPNDVVMYNSPGCAVAVHPARGRALAAFMFRHNPAETFDHRDDGQHKRFLADAYADAGWEVPELLQHALSDDDLYFDMISAVRTPKWSRGRVGLVGDAAGCVSLFGDGSTLALAGAFVLGEELAATPLDPSAAFVRYEARHRALVDSKQAGIRQAAAMMIPATRLGITARNLATRLWPVGVAAAWVASSFSRHARA